MSKGRSQRRAARIAANANKPIGSNQIEKNNQGVVANHNRIMATQLQQRTEAFSGPLPHPDHLERYEKIISGGAERIFKMAENQADHRMSIEKLVVGADVRRSDFGLLFGFIIALVVTGSGTYITLQDKSIGGYITMIAPLASIIGLFIYNRNTRPQGDKDTSSRKEKKK